MAEREGFEPSIVLPLYTLSKRADLKQSLGFLGKIKREKENTGCLSESYLSRNYFKYLLKKFTVSNMACCCCSKVPPIVTPS